MPGPTSPPPDSAAIGSQDPCDAVVLGAVQVRGADGGHVAPGGVRARELVAALVLAHGRPVSARALLDDLWWDHDDLADPRAALQTLVSRTRRLVAPGLVTSGPAGYAWSGTSDLGAARAALDAATTALASGAADAALDAARSGLGLWRGEPAADLSPGSPLADALASEAARLAAGLEDALLPALVSAGHDEEALALADRRLAVRPADEAACLAYMTAAGRLGRVNDALRAFASLREALADELGADPGASVSELHERLLRGEVPRPLVRGVDDGGRDEGPAASRARAPEPAPASAAGRRTLAIGLRSAPNALVGRDDDVRDLELTLTTSRLVTVLGPGGLGKTRIAQELAHRAADRGEPVAVVELASVRTDDDVELALATTLGVRDVQGSQRLGDQLPLPDTRGRILDRLRAPGTLLVLDNCEHVLDGAAAWVADVLAETPARVVTTSRAPLALAAEVVRPLPPLASRAGGHGPRGEATAPGPAVELFEQRARAARPDAPLPRDIVARLCERLDGLPLAIELAAARVRSMSVAEVERRLASRFALLTSGDRAAPERHRTLRAVIDWSWNLLGSGEQALLRRMSVLPGAFGVEQAEAVSASFDRREVDAGGLATLDLLDGLVGQSMLVVADDPVSGTTRYRMLETVREFGALKLDRADEGAAVREAVYAWAVGFARAQRGRLVGHEQIGTIRRLRTDQDNLVQVLRWAVEDRRRDVLAPVFALLVRYWVLRSQLGEMVGFGFEVADVFVGHEATAEDVDDLVWLYVAAGSPVALLVDQARAYRSFARLHRLARSPLPLRGETRALASLVTVIADPQAQTGLPSLLEGLRRDDDWVVSMQAHLLSAQIAENGGATEDARSLARRGYDIASEHGDTWGMAMGAQTLAELAAESAQHAEALRWAVLAREGVAGFDAEPFLFQLDSLEANALVALGRQEEAEPFLDRLAETTGASPMPGPPGAVEDFVTESDRRIAAIIGRAHAAFERGDVERALALATTAADELRLQGRQGMQGRIVQGAHRFVMALLDAESARREGREAVTDVALRESWARELRANLRGVLRATPNHVDRPVLGAVALALGGYLWSTPEVGRVDDGLELLALAARVGSRQDYVTLDRAAHRRAAVDRCGARAVEAAEERAAAVADPTARILELIEQLPWRRSAG